MSAGSAVLPWTTALEQRLAERRGVGLVGVALLSLSPALVPAGKNMTNKLRNVPLNFLVCFSFHQFRKNF